MPCLPLPSQLLLLAQGRGDKRSRKGKAKAGSFGKSRPQRTPEKIRFNKPASWLARHGEGVVAPTAPVGSDKEPEQEVEAASESVSGEEAEPSPRAAEEPLEAAAMGAE